MGVAELQHVAIGLVAFLAVCALLLLCVDVIRSLD